MVAVAQEYQFTLGHAFFYDPGIEDTYARWLDVAADNNWQTDDIPTSYYCNALHERDDFIAGNTSEGHNAIKAFTHAYLVDAIESQYPSHPPQQVHRAAGRAVKLHPVETPKQLDPTLPLLVQRTFLIVADMENQLTRTHQQVQTVPYYSLADEKLLNMSTFELAIPAVITTLNLELAALAARAQFLHEPFNTALALSLAIGTLAATPLYLLVKHNYRTANRPPIAALQKDLIDPLSQVVTDMARSSQKQTQAL